jgi:phosphoribosyl 1,2-cyclic phosphate phosphodiesterase
MLLSRTTHVDAVLFTHAHSDHLVGLDDVRPFNFMQRRHMPLYGSAHTLGAIRRMFAYAFDKEPYPGAPMLETIEIDVTRPFEVNSLTITPLPVEHAGMPTIGFRIGGLSYITDAKSVPEKTRTLIKDSEVLVLNALRTETHHSHMTLDEALALIAEVRPQRAFLTHISHQLGQHVAVSGNLPAHVALAYDGLRVVV